MPATFEMGAGAVFKIDSTNGGSLVDISEYVNEVQMSGSKDFKEMSRIGNNQTAKIAGPVSTDIKLKIWYDPTVIAMFRAASLTSGTATRSFEYGPAGTAGGSEKLTGEVSIGAIDETTNADDPHSFDVPLGVAASGVTVGSY
jgi:hypothetical protein